MKLRLSQFEDAVLLLLVAGLLILACGQILLRNVFGLTFIGTDNLVRHLVLWIGMFGALSATRLDKHIRIDAVLRLVDPRIRAFFLGGADIVAATVCGLLATIAWRFVLDEREYGTTAFFDIPAWTTQLCFPLAFGLMALRFLVQAVSRLRESKGAQHS